MLSKLKIKHAMQNIFDSFDSIYFSLRVRNCKYEKKRTWDLYNIK